MRLRKANILMQFFFKIYAFLRRTARRSRFFRTQAGVNLHKETEEKIL
jgi:hypothetical protein